MTPLSDVGDRPPDSVALGCRVVAVVLAIGQALPWYTSRALVDEDRYLGNPLPAVDWLVAALALGAVLFPRLLRVAAAAALGSVGVALLLASWDRAEGLSVSLEYGVVVTAASTVLALWLVSRLND